MSLGDRLRDMLDPGTGAPPPGDRHGSRRSRSRAQAQPVNPVRNYEPEPPRQMARAQWIGLGLAAALAVALTAGLVFAILTITRPGEQRAVATPSVTVASPTVPVPISAIFATLTPTPQSGPTSTPTPPTGQRLQVANTDGDGANMRRDPGSTGERLKTIPDGSVVEVIGPDREIDGRVWRNVRDSQGDSGWIIGSLLVPEGSAPPAIAAVPGSGNTPVPATAVPRPTSAGTASRGQVGNTSGQGANIRSEPGSSGRVLKTLPEGANVDVLGPEREIDGRIWRQVRDSQGVVGWIIGGAVVPPGSVPTPTPGPASAPAAKPTSGSAATPGPTTAAPAATKPAGGTTPAPAAKPTNTPPPGGNPIIFEPATPRPKPGASPAPGR